MTQGYCTDKAALIGFLYDDCEPDERDRIATHVAGCPDCTAELASLSATRRQLAAWGPPQAALGFRIDPATMAESLNADSRPPFTVIEGNADARPGRAAVAWWKQPLPAWAQAAAAVLIFAAGVGFGAGNLGTAGDPAAAGTRSGDRSAQGVRSTPVAATQSSTAVASGELARFEEKLQAMQTELAALRATSGPGTAPGPAGNGVTIGQVENLVAATETKLQKEMIMRDAAQQAARARDMQRINNVIDPLQRVHVQELWQQGEPAQSLSGPVIGLRNVSFKP